MLAVWYVETNVMKQRPASIFGARRLRMKEESLSYNMDTCLLNYSTQLNSTVD